MAFTATFTARRQVVGESWVVFYADVAVHLMCSVYIYKEPCRISLRCVLLCSLGGAIFGSAPYIGEMLCGNVAYAVILHHKEDSSWRWPVCILGIGVFVVSGAVAVLIKDPPVGRFIHPSKVCCASRKLKH